MKKYRINGLIAVSTLIVFTSFHQTISFADDTPISVNVKKNSDEDCDYSNAKKELGEAKSRILEVYCTEVKFQNKLLTIANLSNEQIHHAIKDKKDRENVLSLVRNVQTLRKNSQEFIHAMDREFSDLKNMSVEDSALAMNRVYLNHLKPTDSYVRNLQKYNIIFTQVTHTSPGEKSSLGLKPSSKKQFAKLFSDQSKKYGIPDSYPSLDESPSNSIGQYATEAGAASKFKKSESGLNLDTYLIMPVQRLPKHPLFISSIEKEATKESPNSDFSSLKNGLKNLENSTTALNSILNTYDNFQGQILDKNPSRTEQKKLLREKRNAIKLAQSNLSSSQLKFQQTSKDLQKDYQFRKELRTLHEKFNEAEKPKDKNRYEKKLISVLKKYRQFLENLQASNSNLNLNIKGLDLNHLLNKSDSLIQLGKAEQAAGDDVNLKNEALKNAQSELKSLEEYFADLKSKKKLFGKKANIDEIYYQFSQDHCNRPAADEKTIHSLSTDLNSVTSQMNDQEDDQAKRFSASSSSSSTSTSSSEVSLMPGSASGTQPTQAGVFEDSREVSSSDFQTRKDKGKEKVDSDTMQQNAIMKRPSPNAGRPLPSIPAKKNANINRPLPPIPVKKQVEAQSSLQEQLQMKAKNLRSTSTVVPTKKNDDSLKNKLMLSEAYKKATENAKSDKKEENEDDEEWQ